MTKIKSIPKEWEELVNEKTKSDLPKMDEVVNVVNK